MKVFETWFNDLIEKNVLGELFDATIKSVILFIVVSVGISIVQKVVRKFFAVQRDKISSVNERRNITLQKLTENIVSYTGYFFAFIVILEFFGIKATALIAGAGVIGLAIGFGAQNFVKDIVTGFFIIFESQFSVGDWVRIGVIEGTVIEIGIRTTKIRGIHGELNIIPNGSILEVVNYSVYNSIAIVDVGISYESDLDKAMLIIAEELKHLKEKYEDLQSEPVLLGVQNFGASEVTLRITAETTPSKHFVIAREIRKDIKYILERHGIEIPYPKMVLMNTNQPAK
ncbi:MAG: mechanosensitive ion channel family protein [Bacilli bacterium]